MKSTPPHPPEAYEQRDRAILTLVATYRIAIIEVISRVIAHGHNLGHIVRRLADEGLLQLFARALPGGISHIQLTERGAERIGVPKNRAAPLGAGKLDFALAVLVCCCLTAVRRYRIEPSEAQELVSGLRVATNHVYCVSCEDDKNSVSRLLLVQGAAKEVVSSLGTEIETASGEWRKAILSHRFRYVLLVESESKRKSLDAAIVRSELRDTASVRVELAATSASIAKYLREFRNQKEDE